MTFGGVGKSQKQPSWTRCLDSYDVTPGRPGVGTGQEDRRLRITEELMSAGGSRRNAGGEHKFLKCINSLEMRWYGFSSVF